MKHKLNKQKGFTLIELLVVIAIIALLSSVVLASLKSAREKAMLAKTVSEMKSLQTAVEMYRNEFGEYPGDPNSYFDDDDENKVWGGESLNDFVQDYLILNKFISKVPHAPNYPNNCVEGQICYDSGYILGYSTHVYSDSDPNFYNLCGGQKINNYFIYFFANDKKINLPIAQYFYSGEIYNYEGDGPPYTYCLSM